MTIKLNTIPGFLYDTRKSILALGWSSIGIEANYHNYIHPDRPGVVLKLLYNYSL